MGLCRTKDTRDIHDSGGGGFYDVVGAIRTQSARSQYQLDPIGKIFILRGVVGLRTQEILTILLTVVFAT